MHVRTVYRLHRLLELLLHQRKLAANQRAEYRPYMTCVQLVPQFISRDDDTRGVRQHTYPTGAYKKHAHSLRAARTYRCIENQPSINA